MLTSPTADANGYSNTFAPNDFYSLRASGAKRNRAIEASDWMTAATDFISAYGARIGKPYITAMMNTLEVRMVMFVHDKKVATRASFSSLEEIAKDFYLELKKLDTLLPQWTKLSTGVEATTTAKPKLGATLRETGSIINEGILQEKGFEIDAHIVQAETGHVYNIVAFNADQRTVTCSLFEAGASSTSSKKKTVAPPKKITVDRKDLIHGDKWQVSNVKETKFLDPNKIDDASASFDLRASIMVGAIKNAVAVEFGKSSEEGCKVQVTPSVKVFALKKFSAKESFKLVGLTNNVQVLHQDKELLSAAKSMGTGDDWKAYCRSSNDNLSKENDSYFFCKYWAVHSTFDQNVCNCEFQEKEVDIVVIGEKIKIKVPMLVNTKPIAAGDEIVVLKISEEPAEPPNKKFRPAPKAIKRN